VRIGKRWPHGSGWEPFIIRGIVNIKTVTLQLSNAQTYD
jgi:hypothetical protein